MIEKMNLVKLGGLFSTTERQPDGAITFCSWERLDKEAFRKMFPAEYVSAITVDERGLRIALERLPNGAEWDTTAAPEPHSPQPQEGETDCECYGCLKYGSHRHGLTPMQDANELHVTIDDLESKLEIARADLELSEKLLHKAASIHINDEADLAHYLSGEWGVYWHSAQDFLQWQDDPITTTRWPTAIEAYRGIKAMLETWEADHAQQALAAIEGEKGS